MNEARADRTLPWRLEDVDFSDLAADRVRNDESLFFLITAASFVESAADLYTRNLLDYYGDDKPAADWLANHWEREEMQHGRSLRAYVEAAWPEFDWEAAYRGFFKEYSALCNTQQFEGTRGLELAARCMIETGTATLYRMIHDYTDEPVLRRLTANIKSDEVRHFKYFYKFFCGYERRERNGRLRIMVALAKRVREAKSDDAYIAFRHAWQVRHPDRPFKEADYGEFRAALNRLARRHFPYRMAAQMLVTPLSFPARLKTLTSGTLESGLRVFMLR